MSVINTQLVTERWTAGHRSNARKLNKLPDEIWVYVVKQVDNATVCSLRSTCRYFLGLCEIAGVARGRRNTWRPDIMIPQQLTPWWGIYPRGDRLKRMLNKAQFCAPCLKWRTGNAPGTVKSKLEQQLSYWQDPVVEGMACSACGISHPRLFHSAPEREKFNCQAVGLPIITCIGRQASIPMCDHLSLTWDDVLQFNKSVETERGGSRDYPQHIVVCRHNSHKKNCAINTMPQATLRFHDLASGGRIEIRIQWESAIVKLPVDDITGEPQGIAYSQLQELLSSAKTQWDGSTPRLLCPHLRWEDNSLLRPFDPNYCRCWGTDIPLLHDARTCRLRGLAGDCCLCQSSKYNNTGRLLPHTGNGIAVPSLQVTKQVAQTVVRCIPGRGAKAQSLVSRHCG